MNNPVKLIPVGAKVVVQPMKADEVTSGGIFIPDTARQKSQRGTVIATGEREDGTLMTVKVGNSVLFGKEVGIEITVAGEEYIVMQERDIFAIL